MADIQSATAKISRGKKKKEEESNHRENIMACPITQEAIISIFNNNPPK